MNKINDFSGFCLCFPFEFTWNFVSISQDQTNSFSTKNEDKDIDALIDFGLDHDGQDPVWEQTPERNR